MPNVSIAIMYILMINVVYFVLLLNPLIFHCSCQPRAAQTPLIILTCGINFLSANWKGIFQATGPLNGHMLIPQSSVIPDQVPEMCRSRQWAPVLPALLWSRGHSAARCTWTEPRQATVPQVALMH